METKKSGAEPPPETPQPFSKGYKHRHGEPVSDACGEGRHNECTQDLTKCHCTVRGGHTVMHAYMNFGEAEASRASSPHDKEFHNLLDEISKWCSGENEVDDGEDAEDALRYIQDAIKAFLAGEASSVSLPQPRPIDGKFGISADQREEFAERNTVDKDGDMYDAHGNHIPSDAAEEIRYWRNLVIIRPEDERAEFEKWFQGDGCGVEHNSSNPQVWVKEHVQCMWNVWQARAKLAAPQTQWMGNAAKQIAGLKFVSGTLGEAADKILQILQAHAASR